MSAAPQANINWATPKLCTLALELVGEEEGPGPAASPPLDDGEGAVVGLMVELE